MKIERYREIIKAIESDAREKQAAAARDYAMANNPVKVGDTVTDHTCTILVEDISVSCLWSIPSCVYFGPKLTKSGRQYKNGDRESVYQSNLKAINGATLPPKEK